MLSNGKITFFERAKYAYRRAKGVPIECDLRPYEAIVHKAQAIDLSGAKGGEIESRARELRDAMRSAETAESSMPACLALAAEACRRNLGLEPYAEQLVAAAAMCGPKVAQLQTGEGKTLAAALAACYGAMRGGGTHILTANDYLARRDAEWMRPIYEALGLSVASICGRSPPSERRAAYSADVAYLTARELGFDYLRDGLAYDRADILQRRFSSAIVDEADFVLIDEARVPLVIAGNAGGDGIDVRRVDALALSLERDFDYRVDPEGRRVLLTLGGQAKVEAFAGSGAAFEENLDLAKARLFAALHAHRLLARDVDYVVKDGAVRLVDAFTGRVAERRQWPWGIQAALEAKEGLEIGPEGRIYGSITVQHLMGLYPRLAAMTATAVPAAEEFDAVYGMATVVVPPARKSMRRDLPDLVFRTARAKRRAIVAEIAREGASGRPILVGTVSVRESEELSAALAEEGLACVVLNAKNDEEEARLVARAGAFGAITISTNMAGRGTDIRLAEDPRVAGMGGLYVIGTNKHDTRRVDDQLRGRAGRQGEPGTTRFFVSLEDPLFERYGVRDFLPEPYRAAAGGEDAHEDSLMPIEDPAAGKEIARAQSIIEAENSKIRRSLRRSSLIVEFDRRYLRSLRDDALIGGLLPPAVEAAIVDEPGAEREAARPAMVRAFLARADAAWADHLALIEDVKEGIGLRRYGGKDPGIEYARTVGDAFEDAMRDLEAAAIEDCRKALSGAALGGIEGPPDRPSSTWTYVVEEDAMPGFSIGSLSGVAAAILGPLALPLFLAQRAVQALSRLRRRNPRSFPFDREGARD
jgi:preprotein translocase subunit SecA